MDWWYLLSCSEIFPIFHSATQMWIYCSTSKKGFLIPSQPWVYEMPIHNFALYYLMHICAQNIHTNNEITNVDINSFNFILQVLEYFCSHFLKAIHLRITKLQQNLILPLEGWIYALSTWQCASDIEVLIQWVLNRQIQTWACLTY